MQHLLPVCVCGAYDLSISNAPSDSRSNAVSAVTIHPFACFFPYTPVDVAVFLTNARVVVADRIDGGAVFCSAYDVLDVEYTDLRAFSACVDCDTSPLVPSLVYTFVCMAISLANA